MRFLDRQSIIILAIGPIFLVIFFLLNMSKTPYKNKFYVGGEGFDTLQLTDFFNDETPTAISVRPWTKFLNDSSEYLQALEITRADSKFKSAGALDDSILMKDAVWRKIIFKTENRASTLFLGTAAEETKYLYKINDEEWITEIVGTHLPNTSEAYEIVSNPFITLEIPEYSSLTLYTLSSAWNPNLTGNNQLWRFNEILSNRSYLYTFQIERIWEIVPVVFILISIFIYHLVLYFFNRNNTFLLLSLSAISFILLIIRDNDIFVQLLHLDNLGTFADHYFYLASASNFIIVPFTASYLRLPKKSIISSTLLAFSFIYVAYWVITYGAYHLDLYYRAPLLFRRVGYSLLLLSNFLILITTLHQLFKGNRRAITFFAAFGTVFISFMASILFSLGYFDLSNHNLPTAIGFLLFSIGLAQEYRSIQIEHFKTEKERDSLQHKHDLEVIERNRLREINQYKSQLYTNITHEFRTPLTIISGITENIKGHNTEKKLIKRNTNNLLSLVNSMLDLNKIDAGHLTPTWTQVDIVPFIRYLAESYSYSIKIKSIDLKIESLRESLWMDTDPHFLETIINNLLQNAIKYTPINGQISIRILKDDKSNICQIKVADTGRGIPEDNLSKIFDRFYQTSNHKTNIEGGTGIGLAIVKELTNLLNGNVSVSSIIHEGSTFTISLPITQKAPIQSWNREQDEIIKPGSIKIPTHRKKSTPQILIVEDSADIRTYLEMLLSEDFVIITAWNGKEGFNTAIQEIPDIIISDIMMPEMDGIEFCRHIKNDKRTSHIPIIILTAKSTQEDRITGLYEGADAYLIKPFDKRELLIRIEKLLENRQKIREHFQQFGTLPPVKSLENQFVKKVMEHIDTQLNSELYQIEDLAEYMHLSRTQLYRKLKALTGKTFTEILKECRLIKAKKLLASSDRTVSEIAFQVGFSDQAYFSRVFKIVEKCTPLQYRKKTGWHSQTQ